MDNETPIPEPTPRQIKAARVFFKLKQTEAAERFGIFVDTLRDIETEKRQAQKITARAVGAALVAMGVRFDADGGMTLPR